MTRGPNGRHTLHFDRNKNRGLSPATRHLISNDKPVDEISYVVSTHTDHANPRIKYLMIEVNMIEMSRHAKDSSMMKPGVPTSILENCFGALVEDKTLENEDHSGAYVVFYFADSVVAAMNIKAFEDDILRNTNRRPEVRPRKVVSKHDGSEAQVMMAYDFSRDEVEKERYYLRSQE